MYVYVWPVWEEGGRYMGELAYWEVGKCACMCREGGGGFGVYTRLWNVGGW